MSDPLWIDAGIGDTVGTATIAASTDLLTIAAHGLQDGDAVFVDTITGGAATVLFEDRVYFVRNALVNTFALAGAPGGNALLFATDGGADVHTAVPRYTAAELRRAQSMHLTPGDADPFGARQGVRPHTDPIVSVAGTSWTVRDLNAVVYPGLTDQSGPYVVQHPGESGSTVAANGSNPRIDALDLQIQDDAEDASGFRRGHVVYVTGTAAAGPVAPAVTTNALRLATILVPTGGAPSPSVATLGPLTVAAGGIVPLGEDDTAPTAGVYEGMYVDQNEGLFRRTGAAWLALGSPNSPELVPFTSSGSFVKANYPWAHMVAVWCQGAGGGGGGCALTGASEAAAAGGGGGGGFSLEVIPISSLSASETVTIGAGGSGGVGNANGTTGGTSSFGAFLSATGGEGGEGVGASGGSNIGDGGAAGAGVGGQMNMEGDDGRNGSVDGALSPPQVFTRGEGGGSFLGGSSRSSASTQGGNGLPGATYGGGGSGGFNRASQAAKNGGAGASGAIFVWVY